MKKMLSGFKLWLHKDCPARCRQLYIQKCEGSDSVVVSYELYSALEGKKLYADKWCRTGDVLQFKDPRKEKE